MGSAAWRDGSAFIDDRYWPIEEARISILDFGFLRADANQDTVSVWEGSFFRLDDHQQRFERNNARLRLICPYTRAERNAILTDCVRRTGLRNAYVQMVMTRGRAPVGDRDIRNCRNRFYVFCLPYVWLAPEEQRERGLHAHISAIQRVPPQTIEPTIKHYQWLDFEMGLLEAYDAGAETVIVVDRNGDVAEGPGFNVFIVERGRLATPASGVLDGMTRRSIMELCPELGIECATGPIPPARVIAADEVFVTTTAGGVIPVTTVDGRPVGGGTPGPLTLRLNGAYWSRRAAGWHATPIDYRAPAAAGTAAG